MHVNNIVRNINVLQIRMGRKRSPNKVFRYLSSYDLVMSNSEFIGNHKIETVEYIISDLSNIKDTNIKNSDVQITKEFAVRTNPLNPLVKLAIVSSRIDLINLIGAFIFEIKTEIPHANYKYFKHIDEAREWVSS